MAGHAEKQAVIGQVRSCARRRVSEQPEQLFPIHLCEEESTVMG